MSEIQVHPAYKIHAFCKFFGIGKSKVYQEIKAGRLKTYKIGRSTLIAGEDAMAWQGRYRKGGEN